MATEQTENAVRRPSWLVWAKTQETSLGPLLAQLEADADTELVKTLGPPAKPHTAVVKMSDETAQRYQQEYQDKYLFELNASMSMEANSA